MGGQQPQGEAERRMAETCPVCGKLFLPAKISAHVDHHLAHDSIELRIGGSRPGLYIGGNLVKTVR